MNLPNGHVLQNGKYRLTQVVGQGGFGITYKGVWYTEVKGPLGTVETEVPVCIKEYFFKDYCYRDSHSFSVKVHSETGKSLFYKFKEKLIKEATILSEVHHPHIVNVLEVFEENDTAYIAMEYIPGNSLKYIMDHDGILPEPEVLKYTAQIGEALQFVHEKSILHLDIKPSNILIDANKKARLIDFGVSKRYDLEQQETSTTMLTLSKGFASIEQYDDEGIQNFSPCPDVYSLGATMYNLLTGKIPTESILRATKPLLSPREINPSITPKTEAVIVKAMEIIPEDRYQSIAEMIAALEIPFNIEKEGKTFTSPKHLQEIEEDETIIYSSTSSPGDADEDDTTIINNKPGTVIPSQRKWKKGVIFSVIFLAFVSSGIVIWVWGNKPNDKKQSELFPSISEDSLQLKMDDSEFEEKIPVEPDSLNTPGQNFIDSSKVSKTPPVQPSLQEKPIASAVSEVQKPAIPAEQPSQKEMDEKYSLFVAAGKEKMEKSDFRNAQIDFAKAKEIKMTEEVLRLIIACDNREKEKRLADRRTEYEEKMTFGKFKIVRKKSTGRYGAIDVNVEERIPCKYLNVGRAENGRAFEREDHLYDIYNEDGILISKGSTFY